MASTNILDLLADGEYVKRSGSTLDGATAIPLVAADIADALMLIVLDNADPPPADGVWLRRPA